MTYIHVHVHVHVVIRPVVVLCNGTMNRYIAIIFFFTPTLQKVASLQTWGAE